MKAAVQGSARRYARALLDVALQRGEAEVVRQELREAVSLIRSHRELQAILEHPAVPAEKKRQIVAAVWMEGRASSLTRRLLALLAERDRIALLPAIEEAFRALWNEHRGVVAAEAVIAAPLADDQHQALTAAIRQATGREVELRTTVDPGQGGGVLVRMLGRTYDGTVRGRLKAMRQRLVQGAART